MPLKLIKKMKSRLNIVWTPSNTYEVTDIEGNYLSKGELISFKVGSKELLIEYHPLDPKWPNFESLLNPDIIILEEDKELLKKANESYFQEQVIEGYETSFKETNNRLKAFKYLFNELGRFPLFGVYMDFEKRVKNCFYDIKKLESLEHELTNNSEDIVVIPRFSKSYEIKTELEALGKYLF